MELAGTGLGADVDADVFDVFGGALMNADVAGKGSQLGPK